MDQEKIELAKSKAKYFYAQGVEYRSSVENNNREVNELFNKKHNSDIRTAVGFSSLLFPDNVPEQSKKEANNDLIKTLLRGNENGFISIVRGTSEKEIVSVANDRKTGRLLNEIVNDMNKADSYETKQVEEQRSVFRYNFSVSFILSFNGEGGKNVPRTQTFSPKNLLLDSSSSVEDIQTSRFIGYDGFSKNIEDIEDIVDKNCQKEFEIFKMSVKTQALEDFLKSKNKRNFVELSEEQKKEYISIMEKQVYDLAKMFVYSEKEKCTYTVLLISKYLVPISIKKRDTVTSFGREIRFFAYGNIGNVEQGHYSQSPMTESLTMVKKEAQVIVDTVEVIRENAKNPFFVPNDIYKTVAKGVQKDQQVFPNTQKLSNRSSVEEFPKPSIGSIVNAVPYLERYFGGLNPESSPELLGKSNARLKSVQDDNISSRRAIVKVLSSRTRRAKEDRMFVLLALLKEYGDSEIFVKTVSIVGEAVMKVAKSRLLSNSRDDTVDRLSISIKDIDPSLKAEKKLEARELFAQLSSRPEVNPKTLTQIMMENYDNVLGGDDLYIMLSPYMRGQVQAAINDIKSTFLGENIRPSVFVTIGYSKTVEDIVSSMMDDFIDNNGELTKTGKRVVEFMKLVSKQYAKNKENPSPLFQKKEDEDIDSELDNKERFSRSLQEGIQDSSKAAFVNQSTFGTSGGLE